MKDSWVCVQRERGGRFFFTDCEGLLALFREGFTTERMGWEGPVREGDYLERRERGGRFHTIFLEIGR